MARTAPVVLVVEDDPDIRSIIEDVLADEGYSVVLADNGQRGLDLARGRAPCLIVLDLTMPVMNGWEFLDHQKADPRLAAIPVIVISAAGRAVLSRLDVTAVLAKPFELDSLVRTVGQHAAASA